MTEDRWVKTQEPLEMIRFILQSHRKRRGALPVSSRQARLLLCAQASLHRAFFSDRMRQVVSFAEQYAFEKRHTPASRDRLDAFSLLARDDPQYREDVENSRISYAPEMAGAASPLHAGYLASICCSRALYIRWCINGFPEEAEQIRAVLGNIFRASLFTPWENARQTSRWLTAQVRSLAWGAVENRRDLALDPAQLAILSDAMEEAGCEDHARLAYLRGGKEAAYPSGCWAVYDLLGLKR